MRLKKKKKGLPPRIADVPSIFADDPLSLLTLPNYPRLLTYLAPTWVPFPPQSPKVHPQTLDANPRATLHIEDYREHQILSNAAPLAHHHYVLFSGFVNTLAVLKPDDLEAQIPVGNQPPTTLFNTASSFSSPPIHPFLSLPQCSSNPQFKPSHGQSPTLNPQQRRHPHSNPNPPGNPSSFHLSPLLFPRRRLHYRNELTSHPSPSSPSPPYSLNANRAHQTSLPKAGLEDTCISDYSAI